MATATTKRVGGAAATTGTKGTTTAAPAGDGKKKGGKSIYDFKSAKDAAGTSLVNDKGQLTAMPPELKDAAGAVVQAAFDPGKHKPIPRKSFADDTVFLRYRALILDHRIARMVALRDTLLGRAENLGKYGDDKKRKLAAKKDRLRKMLEQIEKELEDDEVEEGATAKA